MIGNILEINIMKAKEVDMEVEMEFQANIPEFIAQELDEESEKKVQELCGEIQVILGQAVIRKAEKEAYEFFKKHGDLGLALKELVESIAGEDIKASKFGELIQELKDKLHGGK